MTTTTTPTTKASSVFFQRNSIESAPSCVYRKENEREIAPYIPRAQARQKHSRVYKIRIAKRQEKPRNEYSHCELNLFSVCDLVYTCWLTRLCGTEDPKNEFH